MEEKTFKTKEMPRVKGKMYCSSLLILEKSGRHCPEQECSVGVMTVFWDASNEINSQKING